MGLSARAARQIREGIVMARQVEARARLGRPLDLMPRLTRAAYERTLPWGMSPIPRKRF